MTNLHIVLCRSCSWDFTIEQQLVAMVLLVTADRVWTFGVKGMDFRREGMDLEEVETDLRE